MNSMRSFLFFALLLIVSAAKAQDDFHDEDFGETFSYKKDKGEFLFNGHSHSFTLDVDGNGPIKTVYFPTSVRAGSNIIQATIEAYPQDMVDDPLNLSTDQQKKVLGWYMKDQLE